MSTAITNNNAKTMTIRERLREPATIAEIGKVLPKHITGERMARVALTALTRTPKLAKCDEQSFFKCLMDLSQWGLEPDGRRAHLIPFENRKRGVTECQLIIDYKGYAELVYRSGLVKMLHADVVHEGDIFDFNLGRVTTHVPWFLRHDAAKPEKRGNMYAVYCMAELEGGATKFEVMSVDEVNAIRARSKSGNSGPWTSDFSEMSKKTVFRRLSKWLPMSADIVDALDRDDDKLLDTVDVQQIHPQPASSIAALLESSDTSDDGDVFDSPGLQDEPTQALPEKKPNARETASDASQAVAALKAAPTEKKLWDVLNSLPESVKGEQKISTTFDDCLAKFQKEMEGGK